jgi:hypothetical protein
MWGSTLLSTLARMLLQPCSQVQLANPCHSCPLYPNNLGQQWVHCLEFFVRQWVLQLAAPLKHQRISKYQVGHGLVREQHAPRPANGQRWTPAPPRTQHRQDLSRPLIPWWMCHSRSPPPSPICLSVLHLSSPLEQSIFWLQPLRQLPARTSFLVSSRRPGRV